MARQELALQFPNSSGIIPSWSTPTVDGFMISNDGDVHVHVKNANAGTVTVTIQTPNAVDGNAVADKTVTILTGAEKEFIFLTGPYNQPDTSADAGKIYMDFSPFASVSVKATHK